MFCKRSGADHLTYRNRNFDLQVCLLAASQGQHDQAVRVAAGSRLGQEGAECELAVGPGLDQPVGPPVPERDGGEERADQLPALVFQRKRRHGQPCVIAEQRDDGRDVPRLVGLGKPFGEILLGRAASCYGGWRGRA